MFGWYGKYDPHSNRICFLNWIILNYVFKKLKGSDIKTISKW